MKLNIKGVIVPNDYKHVYDYFGIESTSAKDVSDALDAANGQPLEVYINSGGGYVRAGNEIYTLLAEYGGGVNIKIIFAMAGHSAISPVGQLMIHNVASTAEGDYRAMHHAGDVLETANDSLANAYMRKSGKTRDEIRAMMDAETWITAQRAVELGLVDEIMGGDLVAGLGAELLPDSVIQKTLAMFREDKSAELAQAETDYQNLLKKE